MEALAFLFLLDLQQLLPHRGQVLEAR